jgi:hypothetical protein
MENDTSLTNDSDEVPITVNVSLFMCIPSLGYEYFFRTYIPIFDILLVAVIPLFLLCFTNIGIIIYTMRNNTRMRQHRKRAHRRHQRLTIMLLSVTLAFIGLTCPSVIFICVNKIIYSMNVRIQEKANNSPPCGVFRSSQPWNVQFIVDVCEALWYTKHAMNFILYTLSGQDFRREFLKVLTQCYHHRSIMTNKLVNPTAVINQEGQDPSLAQRSVIVTTSMTTTTATTTTTTTTSSSSAQRKKSKKSNNAHQGRMSVVLVNSKSSPLIIQSD